MSEPRSSARLRMPRNRSELLTFGMPHSRFCSSSRDISALPSPSARCDHGRGVRKFWFDLSLWYAFTGAHLDGAEPPMGFTKADAARVVTEEFGRNKP